MKLFNTLNHIILQIIFYKLDPSVYPATCRTQRKAKKNTLQLILKPCELGRETHDIFDFIEIYRNYNPLLTLPHCHTTASIIYHGFISVIVIYKFTLVYYYPNIIELNSLFRCTDLKIYSFEIK